MNILCWNTDEAVWNHWNKVVGPSVSLIRMRRFDEINDALKESGAIYSYCFIFLADQNFSENVENVVKLCRDYPDQKVIVFPNQPSQAASLRLFSVGVNGQCAPYIGSEQLKLVLSVVDSGEIWGGKAFIQQLIYQSAEWTQAPGVSSSEVCGLLDESHFSDILLELSERERGVANRVSNGLSNKQIAHELNITERTVKAHLTAIFKKTQTKDRLSLALLVQNVSRMASS